MTSCEGYTVSLCCLVYVLLYSRCRRSLTCYHETVTSKIHLWPDYKLNMRASASYRTVNAVYPQPYHSKHILDSFSSWSFSPLQTLKSWLGLNAVA